MESNKQVQRAGDNSQQLQMVNPTFNVGITEERAREIFSEMNAIARQSYTQDAYELAIKRVGMFEELLMKKVEQVDGMLEAFRDPSFQFLLVEAQKRAAASDRESDFEMLTELLTQRMERKDDRKIKASISKAVEIVDQIDDDALCGLTLAYSIQTLFAQANDISQGLKTMNNLFSSLCYRNLPTEFDWVYHLDILNAVRTSSITKFSNFRDFYAHEFNGYICTGIQIGSENFEKASQLLGEIGLSVKILVPHELNEGYVRLNVRNRSAISELQWTSFAPGQIPTATRKISPQESDILYRVWELYSNNSTMLEQVKDAFITKWDSFEALRQVRTWWEAFPHGFTITPIGKVLAHANAQRYCNLVPNLR